MKIMVFLHGTAIMHRGGLGKTPEERGKQVEKNEESVLRFEDYVPVDNANKKLRKWQQQGSQNNIFKFASKRGRCKKRY